MRERGVVVTYNSDSDELARRLNVEAAKAVKYGGVPEIDALDFVTFNAAKQLGIDARDRHRSRPARTPTSSSGPALPCPSTRSPSRPSWTASGSSIATGTWRSATRKEKERAEAVAKIRGDAKKPGGSSAEESKARPTPPAVPAAYADRLAATGAAVSILHATVHTVSGARSRMGRSPSAPAGSSRSGAGSRRFPGPRSSTRRASTSGPA